MGSALAALSPRRRSPPWLLCGEAGLTAIDRVRLIAALIAVVTIAGLTTLATTLNAHYNAIATKIGA